MLIVTDILQVLAHFVDPASGGLSATPGPGKKEVLLHILLRRCRRVGEESAWYSAAPVSLPPSPSLSKIQAALSQTDTIISDVSPSHVPILPSSRWNQQADRYE